MLSLKNGVRLFIIPCNPCIFILVWPRPVCMGLLQLDEEFLQAKDDHSRKSQLALPHNLPIYPLQLDRLLLDCDHPRYPKDPTMKQLYLTKFKDILSRVPKINEIEDTPSLHTLKYFQECSDRGGKTAFQQDLLLVPELAADRSSYASEKLGKVQNYYESTHIFNFLG